MIPNRTRRRLEELEQSMGARDDKPLDLQIVFVSPDGSKSDPITPEEIQRRYQEHSEG